MKAIIVNGVVSDTPESVCTGWATHFEKLAEPLQCEQLDQQHLELAHEDILTIENILMKRQSTPINPISEKDSIMPCQG